ncbi:MAG: SH3 domain-containing protein [Bdellovibrio sp.]
MRSVLALFSNLIFCSNAYAALTAESLAAVSFFRDKTSLFPSGQASRNTLEETLLRSETEFLYFSSWDKKQFFLEGHQLLRDIQVSRFVETKVECKLLSLNRSYAPPVKTVTAQTQLEIVAVDGFWVRVKELKSGQQGWITLPYLQTRHDDLGFFVNIMDTYLRKEPNIKSQILTTLPRLTRVLPLEINKNYLKIQYEKITGYVDLTDFVSKADYANLAYHPKKNWMSISYRNNDQLINSLGESIPLKEILGYATNSHRGIVVRADSSYGPPLRSRVEIIKPEAYDWGISSLEGHGEVWWKKKNLLLENLDKPLHDAISTDDLMKREIYSISFANKNSIKGIVSSEGIYRTEDGTTWNYISQFGKKNYPVHINTNGDWFVGPYKSKDEGKTFEPFIRWDQIAQVIESAYHQNLKILRLTKIESLPNSQIQIHVDTGHGKIKLRNSLVQTSWSVIREP